MAMCEINSPPSLHAVLSLQVKAGKDEGEEWMMGSYSTQRLLYSCLGLDLLAAFFFGSFRWFLPTVGPTGPSVPQHLDWKLSSLAARASTSIHLVSKVFKI